MIDTIKDRENLYERLLPKPGEKTDRGTNRWMFQNQPDPETMRCHIYHDVLWPQFKFIASRCRECYKIVIKPNTVVDLFDLYEVQRKLGYHCKCGTDNRDNTSGIYGGYFYCEGLDQGKKRFNEVRDIIPSRIEVILKRYCTEYEIGTGIGPSNQLSEMTKEEKQFERYFLKNFIEYDKRILQAYDHAVELITDMPLYIQKAVMIRWIHDARNSGDQTYKEFTGGYDLYNRCVTYHD
jgi:hypothetical protein